MTTDDILDAIDQSLYDCEVSADAMRWTPDKPADEWRPLGYTEEGAPAALRAGPALREEPLSDAHRFARSIGCTCFDTLADVCPRHRSFGPDYAEVPLPYIDEAHEQHEEALSRRRRRLLRDAYDVARTGNVDALDAVLRAIADIGPVGLERPRGPRGASLSASERERYRRLWGELRGPDGRCYVERAPLDSPRPPRLFVGGTMDGHIVTLLYEPPVAVVAFSGGETGHEIEHQDYARHTVRLTFMGSTWDEYVYVRGKHPDFAYRVALEAAAMLLIGPHRMVSDCTNPRY